MGCVFACFPNDWTKGRKGLIVGVKGKSIALRKEEPKTGQNGQN